MDWPRSVEDGSGAFDRHGGGIVFFARMLPGVRTFISLPAGFFAMPVWRYLVWSTAGTAIWSALFAAAGYGVGSAARPDRPYRRAGLFRRSSSASRSGTSGASSPGSGVRRDPVPERIARPGPAPRRPVVPIVERAFAAARGSRSRCSRPASRASAPAARSASSSSFEKPLLIRAPVRLSRRAALRQLGQLGRDLGQCQADLLRDQSEGQPADVGAQEAPLAARRAQRLDQPLRLVEADRGDRSGRSARPARRSPAIRFRASFPLSKSPLDLNLA